MATTEEKFKLFKNQDFYKLRDEYWKKKALFEDPEFLLDENKEWKRPKELHKDPSLFGKLAPRFDIGQGNLGDCWFLAAMSSIASQKSLLHRVAPMDQGFGDDQHYAGIFHFRFWHYGEWTDVVVDDRLPCENGCLWSAQLQSDGGLWSALLEKAYAKLHGSYEELEGGHTLDALEDLTGGLGEMFDVTNMDMNSYKAILKAYHRGSLMCCSVTEEFDKDLPEGHAYSLTKVHPIDKTTWLVRIRNPWGNEVEWAKDWAESSGKWSSFSKEQLDEIGVSIEADGEFWMHFSDFLTHFRILTICHKNPLCFESEGTMCMRRPWDLKEFSGKWVKGISAGGSNSITETFWQNPQYIITLKEADDEDSRCTLIVSLMQKPRKSRKTLLEIGFYIYDLTDDNAPSERLGIDFFDQNYPIRQSEFAEIREVCKRFELHPGKYCIIPATLRPGMDAQFLLRVFTEKHSVLRENETNTAINKPNDKAFGFPEEISAPNVKQSAEDQQVTKTKDIGGYFKTEAGEDGEINWEQLKQFLDEFIEEEEKISEQICRQMIAAVDVDQTGKLGLQEFQILVTTMSNLQEIFEVYKEKDTEYMKVSNLRKAYTSAGYTVNNHILNSIGQYYATSDGNISFGDFAMAALKLKSFVALMNDEDVENSEVSSSLIKKILEKALFP